MNNGSGMPKRSEGVLVFLKLLVFSMHVYLLDLPYGGCADSVFKSFVLIN